MTRILLGDGSPEEDTSLREELSRAQLRTADVKLSVSPTTRYPFLKRVMDIVLSFALGLALLPIGLVIATAIIMTDGRPVFSKRRRPGREGHEFDVITFRTRYRNSMARIEKFIQANPQFRVGQEPFPDGVDRMRLDRVLRLFGLDCIPPLWNVLRSEMSLVGPSPVFFLLMTSAYASKLKLNANTIRNLRPGIVSLTHALADPTQLANEPLTELYYAHHYSLSLDIKIAVAFILLLCGVPVSKRIALLGLPSVSDITKAISLDEPIVSEQSSNFVRSYENAVARFNRGDSAKAPKV